MRLLFRCNSLHKYSKNNYFCHLTTFKLINYKAAAARLEPICSIHQICKSWKYNGSFLE